MRNQHLRRYVISTWVLRETFANGPYSWALVTGYLGNVPAALYGLLNAFWCIYGWRRAHAHAKAAGRDVSCNEEWASGVNVIEVMHRHAFRVKLHASVNAVSGIIGGAGSLMTASAYIVPIGVWGYIIL